MTLELLRQNIGGESRITGEIIADYNITRSLEGKDSLFEQIRLLNNAIPELVKNISFYKSLNNNAKPSSGLLNVTYKDPSTRKNINVAVKKHEHQKFLEHLSIYHSLLKGKKGATDALAPALPPEKGTEQKFFGYISASNKVFRNLSNKMVENGSFTSLNTDLRKITSPFIINSYVSMMFFSTLLGFIFSLILGIVLFFLGVGFLIIILEILFVPAAAFIIFYGYPSTQRKSLEKEINQELPFVTIYLSAIATSGIEPSKIFSILVVSKDYPFIQREIKKLTNYINFYGYDLSSALKATSKNCPSEKLAQLFDGIATTISSGGELGEFLSKHSETLLFDYRLEREKYTHIAETFMNIYISVVIAAPMIMMMLFILMSLTGFATGFLNPTNIGLLTVLVITLLNLAFLVFLNMKQPKF